MESNREYLIEQRGTISLYPQLTFQKNGYAKKKMNAMESRRINHANEERRRRKQNKKMEKAFRQHQRKARKPWLLNVLSPRKSIILLWIDCLTMIERLVITGVK